MGVSVILVRLVFLSKFVSVASAVPVLLFAPNKVFAPTKSTSVEIVPSSNGLLILSISLSTSLSVLICAERATLNAPRAPSAIVDKPKPAPNAKP